MCSSAGAASAIGTPSASAAATLPSNSKPNAKVVAPGMRRMCLSGIGASGFLDGRLSIKRRAECVRKILCFALGPEVREVEARLLARHVGVQGNHVDAAFAQGVQHRLHF